jgi:hypothetical protein
MGQYKTQNFGYLKEMVWQRIQGWKEKLLSKAGKDILINAITQAIPTYAMSCFDLTKTLCDDIGTMTNHFWWAQHDDENKMHWLLLMVKFCQPSHEFTFGVGMNFISYPLVLTPWYNKFTCACWFWSLMFMQDFSVESKTSGISSLDTS